MSWQDRMIEKKINERDELRKVLAELVRLYLPDGKLVLRILDEEKLWQRADDLLKRLEPGT